MEVILLVLSLLIGGGMPEYQRAVAHYDGAYYACRITLHQRHSGKPNVQGRDTVAEYETLDQNEHDVCVGIVQAMIKSRTHEQGHPEWGGLNRQTPALPPLFPNAYSQIRGTP